MYVTFQERFSLEMLDDILRMMRRVRSVVQHMLSHGTQVPGIHYNGIEILTDHMWKFT